ncbi:uncharacterized protein LOC135811304 [Sycon ciliatum]|uniref:uncharacterized protein LOC135811304 n=1 Tax=Sycon ciliatum TaxID=27933 RepID=UPI0031F67D0D
MGKSTRKKKEKAKDFAKPKLKVGKKVGKAANVTETAFKSSAVHLSTQLEKAAAGSVTTSRGVTVKGLLQQLTHFNCKTRASALSELATLCTNNSEVVSVELGALLAKAGPLAVDSDRRVRQEFAALLRVILSSLSAERLCTKVHLLCAHVACAQTHLNEAVCSDACNLVDIFVELADKAVVREHGIPLLCNLVRHVSGRLKNMSVYGSSEVKTGRGRGGSGGDTAEQAVMRRQLAHLRSIYNFLRALAPASATGDLPSDESTAAVEESSRCVRAADGVCVLYSYSTDMQPNPPTAWSLPRHVLSNLTNPSSKAMSMGSSNDVVSQQPLESLRRVMSQVEPLLAEFWAHTSPTDLFQRLRSGKSPAGSLEFALLTIKSLGLLLKLACDVLRDLQKDSAVNLMSSMSAQLLNCCQVSLQCVDLYNTHLKDSTRCLDLQLTLCRELTSLNDFMSIMHSLPVDGVREPTRGHIRTLLSLRKNITKQHQDMSLGLSLSLKRLASDIGQGSDVSVSMLAQISDVADILADIHVCSTGSEVPAAAAPLVVRMFAIDYGMLIACLTDAVSKLALRCGHDAANDTAKAQTAQRAVGKLMALLDTVYTSRRHDRPHIDRILAAHPHTADVVRQWVRDLCSAVAGDAAALSWLVPVVRCVASTLALRNADDLSLLDGLQE